MKKGAKLKQSPQLAFDTELGPDGHLFVEGVKERLGCFGCSFKYLGGKLQRACVVLTLNFGRVFL